MANKRILIVEDESIVAKDIESSLTGLGYTVAGIVALGEEAVELSGVLKPDLILMDVMLKGAMDGIAAAERIRREHALPVIYLTAYTDQDTLERAKATEAFGYLLKPFEERDLHVTIEMALYKHAAQRKQQEALAREQRLQERLLRAQRMESLGSLAGSVAHNLNNILEPMLSYSDLIARDLPAESVLRQDLEIIRNSAHKAVEIVRDLLTLGRIGHYPKESLVLNRVLEQAARSPGYLALQQSFPLVTVELKPVANLPAIMGSPGLLQELVMNLLSYAFNAMPQGGRVTLATAVESVSEAHTGYEVISPGTYAAVRLQHTGAVIGEQELNRMFEPYCIRESDQSVRCSGLELAVVYAAVKEHDGFIDVRSAPGRGSDFIAYFPVAGALTQERESPLPGEFGGNETILIVDDDDEQRLSAARWLRGSGYKVLTAHNGRAALELVDSSLQTDGAAINLVILDMIMADDFDGLDTYRKMLEFNPRQKVIMASGFAETDRLKEALKLGVGQCIRKPYDFEALGRAVRQELDKG
ncbi:MAG: response regulator [Lentisphaerae bacterium]|nr:response regulator [Lentisphaerota bacterium]